MGRSPAVADLIRRFAIVLFRKPQADDGDQAPSGRTATA